MCIFLCAIVKLKNIFLLLGLGFELRASYLQSSHFTAWATHLVHLGLAILEMGSHKLFAWDDLKLQSFRSQVAKITDVSHQHLVSWKILSQPSQLWFSVYKILRGTYSDHSNLNVNSIRYVMNLFLQLKNRYWARNSGTCL
jgi:hypothetical protein